MSTFSPESFMSSQFTDANETTFKAVPEGEYSAVINKVECNSWQSKDGSKSGLKLDIDWIIDEESVRVATGMAEPHVKQSIMLDMTESGGLAVGTNKNVNLGRLRDAVNQNASGRPWSPPMLQGQVARVAVKHRLWEDQTFAEVKGVTKL
jgi:hypothetical protein